ncbi:thymidylate kinase-like [Centruroides sculpturatus]|uniref:thymidylate kinase-like n=1 Tax=Centruroides sculpturatus TaxID=218467 RepID=UPI000C6DDFE3|nr:thymidylate kinase-like [Centruroides sculpturatus]XP_023234782.1 thymidylate kinase-like [Centruroides sculpturatus]
MNNIISRGAFIVLEGCDRVGKSTLTRFLVENLRNNGMKVESLHFPNRKTKTGILIDKYLKCEEELDDHAIHLLFSANRWESVSEMCNLINSGTTLIVDRYAYSGVAYSASKKGLDVNWCKQPEIGLPSPDLVIFLDILPHKVFERCEFGKERYENLELQMKARENFLSLKEDNWKVWMSLNY